MITRQKFEQRYFYIKWRELEYHLRDLAEAADSDRRGHIRYVSELLTDFQTEFLHVMMYGEQQSWPVCEQWERYWKLISEQLENEKISIASCNATSGRGSAHHSGARIFCKTPAGKPALNE